MSGSNITFNNDNNVVIQTGGIDPLKLSSSIDNFYYTNFMAYSNTIDWNENDAYPNNSIPISNFVKDTTKPFIFYRKRRDWVAQMYPYSEYLINIIKNIKWNKFKYTLQYNNTNLNISLGKTPYSFFGGSCLEFYNANSYYHSLEDLNDYVSTTADIDMEVNIIISFNQLPNISEKKQIETKITDLFIEFINKEIEIIKSLFENIVDNIEIKTEKRLGVKIINIMLTLNGYSDHIIEIFINVYYYDYTNDTYDINRLIDTKYNSTINLINEKTTNSNINNRISNRISNHISNRKQTNKYYVRNLWYEMIRNNEIICNKIIDKRCILLTTMIYFDKEYNRLKRFEYTLKLSMKILLDYNKNDILIKFLLSDEDIKTHVLTYILDIFSNPEKTAYLIVLNKNLNKNNIYQIEISNIKKKLRDYIKMKNIDTGHIKYHLLQPFFEKIIKAINKI
jgi:hypothetical protein